MAAAVLGGRARIDALREQIEDSLVTSISERRFLPIDKVERIFTLSAIKDAVQELNCQPERRINLAETIHHNGKAVFAMLIDMWQEDLIMRFREHGVLDDQFPLDTVRAQEIVGASIARRLVSEVQWKFLPYVFPERMWECRAYIEDQRILPFVGREQIGSGAFGEVEKISVYPAQQSFAEQNVAEVHIVRKRLIGSGGDNDFEREDKCLRLLNGLRHPNIVQFLGSYTHKKQHNFLFPYIETNLGKVLSAEKRHGGFQWDFTFYAALTGLASALAKTHHLVLDEKEHGVQFEAIGYHHDLRPPNVLVSHDSFILADFGLGSLKDARALSNTPYKIISGDYIAPECTDMEESPQTVSRAIDVWAFGCLILEVLTYMLKGPDGVKEFCDKRHTPGRLPRWKDSGFYQPHPGGGIKNEVLEWIEGLRRDTAATETEACLMELGQDALQADPRKRPTMDEMHRRLVEASILKHFNTVQDMFQIARRFKGPHASDDQHRLESLRLAEERFDSWGRALSLREKGVSSHCGELKGKPFEIATTLFHMLREEPEQRVSGGPSSLRSFEDRMDRKIIELWDLLSIELLERANEYLGQSASAHDLHEQVLSQSQISHDHNTSECATPSADTLLREFESLTHRFKNQLSESVSLDELTKTKSLGNVYDLVDDLQHNQELRNLPKMELFLERLHRFTEILGDTIPGSCEYFQWVWGPLGLLLRRSRGFDMAYIAVIAAMAEIGEALPDFHALDAFLRQNGESKEVLVLVFKDLLEFYSVTLPPFSHPGWTFIFDRSWPKIRELVLEVSSHMSRLSRLMRTEISLEHIQKEYDFRKNALETFQKQATETRRQEFNRIKTSLRPREYHETLYKVGGVRSTGSGNWLFCNKVYTQWWCNKSQVESRILWLKGIPGAGKTVLSSAIIDHLKSEQRLAPFAFLTYEDEKISTLSIMHSLIFQLAERDDGLVDAVCESMSEELKNDLATATGLLKSLILHAGAVCLVIDGVDEISKIERGRMIAELLELFKSCEGLRMILSSRPEADLVRALGGMTVVIQVHDYNEQNIEGYVKESTQKMFRDRGVLQRDQPEIRMLLAPLARRAKGMFLYARLIMEMVGTMYDLAEIREELAVLPESLDDAYRRIILRLDKHGNKIQREKAKRLLGWIACTSVPLTIEEAQQALAVNPRNLEQTYSVFAKLDPVELLGPIVETAGGHIRFVHFTAKQYLSSAHLGVPLVDINQATLDLAIRCIDYLCQCHHDPSLSSEEVSEKLVTGQYSLDGFASRMWFELSCQYIRSVRTFDVSTTLVDSIYRLCESRKRQGLPEVLSLINDEDDHNDSQYDSEYEVGDQWVPREIKQQHPLLHHLLCKVSHVRCFSFVYTGEPDQNRVENEQDPLSLLDTSKRIREILDKEICNDPGVKCGYTDPELHRNCPYILHHYGQRPFKCKFLQCGSWRQGFQTRTRREQHERFHENPVKCHVPGCKFARTGFLSENMRKKHLQERHSNDPPQPKFDTLDLDDDSVLPLLHYLVTQDQVQNVEIVLSKSPTLEDDDTKKLRETASSSASTVMLQLLNQKFGETKDQTSIFRCIFRSIEGHHETTLEYNLMRMPRLMYADYIGSMNVFVKLLSSGWLAGMKIWCKLVRNDFDGSRGHRGSLSSAPVTSVKRLLSHPRSINEASKHYSAEEIMLYVWKESELMLFINEVPGWAGQTLRHVAKSGRSITLASELLSKGANVNFQPIPFTRTALGWAARNDSAEGDEMMRFLLFEGADPRTQYSSVVPPEPGQRGLVPEVRITKSIRDEKGAKNIQKWLGKSWDDLVEETKHLRNEEQVEQRVTSGKTEGTTQHQLLR